MIQYNITIDSEISHYLFTTGTKDEKLAKFLELILNQFQQHKLLQQIKTKPYERTEERQDYRNSYYFCEFNYQGSDFGFKRTETSQWQI
ncbi:hypothetical protein CaldiYA01_08720 [Caldicellulosiruptor diazotrophicus]|uniref:Uncharacterized protein n=1 Tax=Caldicellulosiruptor diazotrophicus TaxID=2806205 RepID=A0ABM7NLD6_9FIRM|nr:transposase [Caldicellulosiruptor diazotrophicus]BCS80912.1 hypothetical protein CaldiYA01_08720 [Caldicellulosiruptor diazotrophicus]